jgi:hypothetical protein
MRSTSHRLVTVLLAAAVLVGASAGPAAAADWTAEPAPNHFGAGRQDYHYTLNPGGRLEDGVVVVNHGTEPLRLRSTGVGAWVRLDRGDVTIAPGESAEVPFSFTVPGDAKPGDHVGDIAGIPIRLRVGGALEPSLSVEDVDVRHSGGDATVTYTIRNTGNVILTARQSVSVAGPFGRWAVDAGRLAETPQLLPGTAWKGAAPLHDVTPALRLTATVTLVPLLTDASGSVAPLPATEASGHAWTVPWSLLLAICALGALAVAGASLSRRRRTSRSGREHSPRPRRRGSGSAPDGGALMASQPAAFRSGPCSFSEH